MSEPTLSEQIAAVRRIVTDIENGHIWDSADLDDDEIACLRAVLASLEAQQEAEAAPMDTAPRNGTDIRLVIPRCIVPAYWDDDLHKWVLCRPWYMESVSNPAGWLQAAPSRPGEDK